MDTREQMIADLQRLGMSGYEAKAYVALAAAGTSLTGYEVAKQSGVPRSTVYETLGKLIARGAAFETRTDGAGSAAYLALPPDELLHRLRRGFEDSFRSLSETLPQVRPRVTARLSHHLAGVAAVRERAQDLIENAHSHLVASIWPQEAAGLHDALREADTRGVDVQLVTFGDVTPVGETHRHRLARPDVVLDRVGCRLLVVVADRRAVLIAGEDSSGYWGCYSEDPAVVLVALEFMRHDIAIQVLAGELGLEEVERIWYSHPQLEHARAGRTWQRNDDRA